tara:strand:- start:3223 stop:4047 length:825 start_codon:yes stop_codon:yes gene_type:complete
MKTSLIAAVLLGVAFTTAILWSEISFSSSLEVAFFDVGQGDAIFLETPQGHQVLIDGGPDDTVLLGLNKVMPFWDRTIDLVILTHPDADHITGLVEVLKRYEVSHVLWTGVEKDTKSFEAWKQELEREGTKETIATAGQKIRWSQDLKEVLEILYPQEKPKGNAKTNETSIIAKLIYHKNSVLFSADTTKKIEALLLKEEKNLKAAILKVAHHGSKTSSSREFLQSVKPLVAVISVGKENRYGHPHPEILARLHEYGIEIRRTDKEGTIYYYFR